MNRIQYFHQALLALSKFSLGEDVSHIDAFRRITESASRLLEVGRVSIWLLQRRPDRLLLADRYDAANDLHEAGASRPLSELDGLLRRLEEVRVLTVPEVRLDPQLAAFYREEQVLVGAVLGAPVRRGTELAGGISFEHTGGRRSWGEDEQQAAGAIADLIALTLGKVEQDQTAHNLRRALKELERQQEALDRHAIISVCRPDGAIIHVNDRFCEVSGYRRRELLGQDHRLLNSGHHPPAFFQAMWRTVTEGRIWQGEIRNRRKDGSHYWVESTVVPMLDGRGRIERYVSIHTDVTAIMEAEATLRERNERLDEQVKRQVAELQQVHAQLLQSEKMASIGQLAAGVAHEINNPVGYINSNLGTLEQYAANLLELLELYREAEAHLPTDDPLRARLEQTRERIDLAYLSSDLGDLIQESREGVDRVRRIVRDLKDFSRSSEERWELCDLHRTLEATLNVVHNELKYKADVVCDLGDLPEIECVPAQLGQVFMNLLVNAAQAIEGRGTICVRSGRQGDWAWFEISDTGRGIPAEHLGRLFEPFFTTKPVGQGTGLGLSVSYGIVRKHGGRIEVHSTPGAGSRFTVHIPIGQSAQEVGHERDSA